jgi:hypothetical protein
MQRTLLLALGLAVALVAGAQHRTAAALPLFAHQYGFTCQTCHSVVPKLNAFGQAFMANGDRLPGVKPRAAFPIAVKANGLFASEPPGSGLPKAVVDEVEAFTAGAIGSRASYLVEQYLVDGGVPGLIRDAWVSDRVNPWDARIPIYAQAGSFTLPLPVDPETFRDTYAGYAIYAQTVGENPFTFFDPKIGALVSVGDRLRGLSAQLFAGPGHDRQSGLPSYGTDWMGYAQHAMGPVALSLYRYEGTRPLGTQPDRFQRTGYAVVYDDGERWEVDDVLQTGWDSNCGVAASFGCASSGGFIQLRYMFSRRLFAQGRYEGTNDPSGMQRDAVFLLGYGPTRNTRITIEDLIRHAPRTTHTLATQFLLAY